MYVHPSSFCIYHLTSPRPTVALAVACRDIDVRNVKALIMGPHETPYEFGLFEVGRQRLTNMPETEIAK